MLWLLQLVAQLCWLGVIRMKHLTTIALTALTLSSPSMGLAGPLSLENGAFVQCDSTSGAYTTKATNYKTYLHNPISFSALIDSFGEMKINSGDVLDFSPFKSMEGKAYGYYGQSTYSSFQLESATGRFFFVQNMPDEAFMITGICRYRQIHRLLKAVNGHDQTYSFNAIMQQIPRGFNINDCY